LDSKSIDNGYRLKILGNFESLPYFPPGDSIMLSNSVSDKVLQEELEGASALLLFSFSEGFGIPIIEAAFRGTISLTSETSSLRELIDPNRKAIIALTHVDITNKINQYLDSMEYREVLERDRQYVVSLFSEERFKENWRSLLENIRGGC
jgi:glycosyltransferase involved in cell wall biosynthesis